VTEHSPARPTGWQQGRSQKQAPTIYDIADATGFSPSAVSRALHKPGRLNPATEQRIREAARQLGYQINPAARALHTGQTGVIGLVLSSITNPVYFELIRGVEKVVRDAGRTLLLAESQESREQELETVTRLIPGIDGLLLAASRLTEEELRDLAERKPTVLVNRAVEGVRSVLPERNQGLTAALAHLHTLGHRSLAFVGGPESWVQSARWSDVLAVARAQGMSVVEISAESATVEGGRGCLERVLAAGVTAVHTFNDLVAIGLMTACRAEGVSIPEQLSIVGNDDIFGADFTTPALTTIRIPLDQIGAAAVQWLLDSDEPRPEGSVDFPSELVVRESTGPARPS